MMDFITQREEFDELLALASSIFVLDARFPEQVFRRPPVRSACIEYERLFDPEVWEALCGLASASGDASIACLEIDSDPTDIELRGGHYGAFVLPVTAKAVELDALMWREAAARFRYSIRMGNDVLTFVSTSGAVTVWGERRLEAAVVGLHARPGWPLPEWTAGIAWLTAEEQLGLMTMPFGGDPVPDELALPFLAHYGRAFERGGIPL